MKKILLFLLFGLIFSSNLTAQDINWEIKSEEKIYWLESYKDSLLIVGSKNKITAYTSESGEFVWEIPDFNNVDKTTFTHLNGTDKALVFQYKQNFPDRRDPVRNKIFPHLIDMPSGKIIANYETMEIYHDLGVYRLPNDNLLFYSYNNKKEISIRVLDIYEGEIVWVDSMVYKENEPKVLKFKQTENLTIRTIIGNQPPVFDSDSTMIILDNKKYVRKWNFLTGEILWSKEFKQKRHMVKKDNFAFAKLNFDNSILYMPLNNSLCAIDVADGSVVWQTSDIKKRIKQITQNETYLILKTVGLKSKKRSLFLSKIDKSDGTVIYTTKKICNKDNDLPLVWHNNKLILYADKYIYSFDHEKNESVRLPEKIKFKHGDQPQKFSLVNNHYYLLSSQNLMQVDSVGNINFHTKVRPPEISLGKALLMVAVIGFAIKSNSFLNLDVPDYRYSKLSKSYLYMLDRNVRQDNKRCDGIAKINFLTGELVSQLCLHTKTPIYTAGEVYDCLYYVKDKKTIISQSW